MLYTKAPRLEQSQQYGSSIGCGCFVIPQKDPFNGVILDFGQKILVSQKRKMSELSGFFELDFSWFTNSDPKYN